MRVKVYDESGEDKLADFRPKNPPREGEVLRVFDSVNNEVGPVSGIVRDVKRVYDIRKTGGLASQVREEIAKVRIRREQ